jgi:hypothetical protein
MQIVPYFIQNNAEHDAIDLLMEVDKLEHLKDVKKQTNKQIHLHIYKKNTPYI